MWKEKFRMKYNFLQILCCPKCCAQLGIRNTVVRNGEVEKGELRCVKCAASFPIIGYIPRLVHKANYSSSWGKLWRETEEIVRDSFTGIPFYYNAIHGRYSQEEGACQDGHSPFGFEWPRDLVGETILEVGPGSGNCTEHLVNTGAHLICVEMSSAIHTFPEELLTRPNINVVQSDINDPILKPEYFDRIWLFQVLQHTPSPPDTLQRMWWLLKKGGELAFTSYKGYFNPWYYRFTKRIDDEIAWKLINYFIPKVVPLKYRIQKAKVPFISRLLVKLLAPVDPRNIYFNTLEGRANEYLHGVLWNRNHDEELLTKYVILNRFDRITPKYTNSADHETIKQWIQNAGFSSVKTWGKGGVRAKAFK
jgi:uncharacterized protein YbaR (Trm112 family)/2-polyprenyl-3-methyl-5-hydroxy-6-metoxy-1,4-benzoquinol methylase